MLYRGPDVDACCCFPYSCQYEGVFCVASLFICFFNLSLTNFLYRQCMVDFVSVYVGLFLIRGNGLVAVARKAK